VENQQARGVLDKLGDKVAQMVQQIQELQEENRMLKNDLMNAQVQNESDSARIAQLENDNAAKEREIEEIVSKIESILG